MHTNHDTTIQKNGPILFQHWFWNFHHEIRCITKANRIPLGALPEVYCWGSQRPAQEGPQAHRQQQEGCWQQTHGPKVCKTPPPLPSPRPTTATEDVLQQPGPSGLQRQHPVQQQQQHPVPGPGGVTVVLNTWLSFCPHLPLSSVSAAGPPRLQVMSLYCTVLHCTVTHCTALYFIVLKCACHCIWQYCNINAIPWIVFSLNQCDCYRFCL